MPDCDDYEDYDDSFYMGDDELDEEDEDDWP